MNPGRARMMIATSLMMHAAGVAPKDAERALLEMVDPQPRPNIIDRFIGSPKKKGKRRPGARARGKKPGKRATRGGSQ